MFPNRSKLFLAGSTSLLAEKLRGSRTMRRGNPRIVKMACPCCCREPAHQKAISASE